MSVLYKEIVFPVRVSDFDSNDNFSPTAILDYFQQMAGIHADEMKIGFHELIAQNLVWVIIRSKFEIIANPKTNESIIVSTWPRPKGKIDFDRDYEIKTLEGKLLVKGTSKWVLVNSQNRKVVRSDKIDYSGEFYNKKVDIETNKIDISDIIFQLKPYSHTVANTDLDHNGHMNNAKYADIIINTLDNLNNFKIKNFEINYVFESRKNDIIETYHHKSNNIYYFHGLNNQKQCFIVKIETEEC